MSDEFEKWAFDTSCYIVTQKEAFYAGFAAGRAQAERDIMARWPSEDDALNAADDYVQNDWEDNWTNCMIWLRTKLFPNDKRDEVE